MKIEITGAKCISCKKYSQYYAIGSKGELDAIDCGFCGVTQRNTKPWNRCKNYSERGNVGLSQERLVTYRILNENGIKK